MFDTKKKRKHKFKLPSAVTILFILVLLVTFISWIPGTTGSWTDASGVVHSGGPAGFFDAFLAPLEGFSTKLGTILFVIILGGFINIVIKSEALDAGIGRLIGKMNGKEIWFIPIVMTLFSIGGTTYGMGEETIALYPVIIPVFLAAGFDVITAVLTILLGAGIGCAGSIINPFVIGVSFNPANTAAFGITNSAGIVWRIALWVILTAITIAFVVWYAKRVKKNPEKSITYNEREFYSKTFAVAATTPEFNKRRKTIMIIFGITFIIMIASLISYSSFGSPTEQWHTWVTKNIPYISSLFPDAFGDFSLLEVGAIFLLSTIVIGFINHDSEENFVNNFFEGSGNILSVCLVIATAGGIGYIMLNTGMQDKLVNTISKPLSKLGTTGFLVLAFILFIPLSIIIPSTSGFAAAVMPILGPVSEGIHHGLWSGTITVFALANGLINLFSPTSFIMMAALAIAKVPLDKYLRTVWKFLVALTVLMIILIVIGSTLPISQGGVYF